MTPPKCPDQDKAGCREPSCKLQQPTAEENRLKRELLKPEPLHLQPRQRDDSKHESNADKPKVVASQAERVLTVPRSGKTTQSRAISYPKIIGLFRISPLGLPTGGPTDGPSCRVQQVTPAWLSRRINLRRRRQT